MRFFNDSGNWMVIVLMTYDFLHRARPSQGWLCSVAEPGLTRRVSEASGEIPRLRVGLVQGCQQINTSRVPQEVTPVAKGAAAEGGRYFCPLSSGLPICLQRVCTMWKRA